MTEKSQLENDRMENAHPENGRKITSGKWQKKHTWKIKELKMHDIGNDRKCHFPGCAFFTIFNVVHLQFSHFPGMLFLLSFRCDISVIFWVCIFHFIIFQVWLFCLSRLWFFYHFLCRAFSIPSFSKCVFLSFSCVWFFFGCAFSILSFSSCDFHRWIFFCQIWFFSTLGWSFLPQFDKIMH